jgi:hypothetical protein
VVVIPIGNKTENNFKLLWEIRKKKSESFNDTASIIRHIPEQVDNTVFQILLIPKNNYFMANKFDVIMNLVIKENLDWYYNIKVTLSSPQQSNSDNKRIDSGMHPASLQ